MSERDRFMEAVRVRTQETPYVVTATEDGFDLALDIVDEHWFGLLSVSGLSMAFTHHVAVPGDGTYAITDDARRVEWDAGVPTLSASVERTRGHVKEVGFEKVWAFRGDGSYGKVVDVRFDSEEGRGVVRSAAKEVGLKQQRGGAERIGLAFAVLGGIGALLTLLLLVLGDALGIL